MSSYFDDRVNILANFFMAAKLSADDIERMKLLANSLAGPGLKGGEAKPVTTPAETQACLKLLANWKIVEAAARKAGLYDFGNGTENQSGD